MTQVRAFPEAEGFGAFARGGRGGVVMLVTSLEDSGPGTLREACAADGPRIVVFQTGGIVELKDDIKLRNPYITIAGQTAPGDGVCLKNYAFCVSGTHDVVVRHMRFRPGDVMRKEMDAVSIDDCTNLIFDHCSASWGIDETFSIRKDMKQATVQWCLISESLTNSIHKKGAHGYGSLVSAYDGGISFHHNIYAHHSSRNPRAGGYKDDLPGMILDFRNNVIYDWGFRAGYSGDNDRVRIDYVANYLKPGPSTKDSVRSFAFHAGGLTTRLYLKDNVIEGSPEKTRDNAGLLAAGESFPKDGDLSACRSPEPFPTPEATATDAATAYEAVLGQAGATTLRRDAVDKRVIEQIRSGGGRLIDSQEDVGGWPAYEAGSPPKDSDWDGMPDAWETENGFDPHLYDDNSADADGDGYTNIEEFLNGTDPRKAD